MCRNDRAKYVLIFIFVCVFGCNGGRFAVAHATLALYSVQCTSSRRSFVPHPRSTRIQTPVRNFEYLDIVRVHEHDSASKQNILFLENQELEEEEKEKEEDGINGYHKRKVKDKREILHSDPMPWALHRIHRYAHPVTLHTYNVTWPRGIYGLWNDRSRNQFGRSARVSFLALKRQEI